ncbi:hypothetical protein [Maridesulfovibrio sp. FT414]
MFMCWLCGIARIVERIFFATTEKGCAVMKEVSRKEKLSTRCTEKY